MPIQSPATSRLVFNADLLHSFRPALHHSLGPQKVMSLLLNAISSPQPALELCLDPQDSSSWCYYFG